MKIQIRHIASLIFILTALLTAVPVKSLHDCNNLSHNHSELSLENIHEDCAVCDISLQSTENVLSLTSFATLGYSVILEAAIERKIELNSTRAHSNRGPPASFA